MRSENTIRESAFRYFAGKATAEDEKALFGYIGQASSHKETFRRWESEWAASGVCDAGTKREWERLNVRMWALEDKTTPVRPRRRLFRQIASVAAVTILGLCGAFGILNLINTLSPAKYYTIDVPLGEKSRVVLADCTLVWLNAGSTLRYSDRFGFFNRSVELIGEGYFEVTKKTGSVFTVKTHAYDVRVTGTKFDVSAYPEDAFVSTTLAEGKVELLRGKQRIPMAPGEAIHLDMHSGNFKRTYVDASLAYSWTENRIEFDNITLRELIAKLSRQYNVKIFLESESVREKRFHISLRNDETIREVLGALKDIIPVRIEFHGDEIYIKE